MKYTSDFEPDFSAREPAANVDPLFLQRWSPRAFKKVSIAHEDLSAILEAARWSPSCFNDQPWHFYTSTESSFDRFLGCLSEKNQAWAKNASVLGFVVARRNFAHNDKPNNHAKFDSGAAWMALTLQARMLGLYTHGMAGILYDNVYDEFDIDRQSHEVICGFVIGVLADEFSAEQAEKEVPNTRKPLADLWTAV